MNLIAQLLKPEPKKTNQVDLFRVAASQAGQVLAIRRRLAAKRKGPDDRKWTGFVFGRKRSWVGQQVVLPDKSVGWIKQAQAGMVCVRTSVTDPLDGAVHDYLGAAALKPYRLPEAVLLGSLKRGKKERTSAVKAAASRRNGATPPKPGHRPRGRPRKRKQEPPIQRIRTLCAELRSALETAPPVS
jgi:hypothetical protein